MVCNVFVTLIENEKDRMTFQLFDIKKNRIPYKWSVTNWSQKLKRISKVLDNAICTNIL